MKTFLSFLLSLFLAVLVCTALPTEGEEAVYTDVVRLHVLANSDTAEDQGLKIAVRDCILSTYGEALSALSSASEAEALLEASLPDIQKTVETFLEERDAPRTVTVKVTEEYFETRAYEDITLPAGTYTALTVTLGEGKGQNWWCVLYPALCTEGAFGERVAAEEAFEEGEYKLLTKSGYAVKFRTLELLGSLFHR